MMNIVEIITAEMNKAREENRITVVEYMKLVKRLRNNEESDIMPIILDYIEELTEQVMSFPAMEERSEFECRFATQLLDVIEFLQDITDKETIINKDTIDKLNEQLISAVAKGDFVTATRITERINNLQSIIEVVDEEETITESVEEPVVVESDEVEFLSPEQARQGQIAFIRKHTEWAINEAIDWAEYLRIPLDEVQIELLREEGLALAERMINNEEYIDYSNGSLKDCIEQSIACIEDMIRDL